MAIHQIIYTNTNVEQAESPRRRGGFQTLFFPEKLMSDNDVREIEKRIHLAGAGFLSATDYLGSSGAKALHLKKCV